MNKNKKEVNERQKDQKSVKWTHFKLTVYYC